LPPPFRSCRGHWQSRRTEQDYISGPHHHRELGRSARLLSLHRVSLHNLDSWMKHKVKSAAMFRGEVRARKREFAVSRAEAAFTEGRYGDVVKFARLAVRCNSRYHPRSRQKLLQWRARLLARIRQAARASGSQCGPSRIKWTGT
jgi:hypothetical protein